MATKVGSSHESASHESAGHAGHEGAARLSRLLRVGILVPVGLGVLCMTACDMIPGMGAPGPEVVAPAHAKLVEGDLPGAAAEYATLSSAHPDSVHVAVGEAYSQLLRGDTSGADATLASAEANAGEKIGEIKLRRALVALQAGDLDSVKLHGAASGLPEGKLLAAEVHLVDLESDEASAILRDIAGAGGAVGATAGKYLEMLDSGDTIRGGLAEASALWALGDRKAACDAAGELARSLSPDDPTRPTQLLLWAGRAITTGQPAIAKSLVDEIDFPPEGQAWRVQATKALIQVANDEVDEGIRVLDALLEGGAPADGVADARATACALVKDRARARELVGELESPAVARCLSEAGADKLAQARAPEGPLKTYLENK